LEKSLEELDLTNNRLKGDLPSELLADFDLIRVLKLDGNALDLAPNLTLNGFRYTIKELSLKGEDMKKLPLSEVSFLRSLRALSTTAVSGDISEKSLSAFPPSLEELDLSGSGSTFLGKRS